MGEYYKQKEKYTIEAADAGQLIQDARNAGYTGNIYIIINGEYYEIAPAGGGKK